MYGGLSAQILLREVQLIHVPFNSDLTKMKILFCKSVKKNVSPFTYLFGLIVVPETPDNYDDTSF